ncbi:hypothetical protein VaNZ11_010540 [Volvox africanus]|uniref:Uncharacterized protein n=1 Tax=Volvox africanus TaxID=51714 RepID=A0ABQ5S9T5_9CHLO|nr:hypothetical protein VaNZ11_010540 [Volvox africanus]
MFSANQLVAIIMFAALALGDDTQDKALHVKKCLENQDCRNHRTSWSHLKNNLPSCIITHRIWWSNKTAGIPITLVTQLSSERLEQLDAQCRTWRGPLAAVVYLSVLNPSRGQLTEQNQLALEEVEAMIDQLFRASEGKVTTGCQLRLALMYELFADPRAAIVLYPLNSLRNYARLMADTDLIANIDVDMLPSASLSGALASSKIFTNYSTTCRAHAVYVLPAFTTVCGEKQLADSLAATGDKEAIRQALNGCLRFFAYHKPMFHGPTQFTKWLDSRDVYSVTYALNYEPWYISWRFWTTWYDFRYRGYGNNKIAQVAAMNATGTVWLVSPHGFLVHRPHASTEIRNEYVRVKTAAIDRSHLRGTIYEHTEALFADLVAGLANGTYVAPIELGVQSCLVSLPWWRSALQQQDQVQKLQQQQQQQRLRQQEQAREQKLQKLRQEQLQEIQEWRRAR